MRPSDVADYLAHIPPGDLRALLDLARDVGHEFTDGQAAADLALDLDRMRHPNPRVRLGRLHARRYYAERWGWPKTRVQEAFAGDRRRGTSGWIEARARDFADRFRTDSGGSESAVATTPRPPGDHSADKKRPANTHTDRSATTPRPPGDHSADKEEQFLPGTTKEEEGDERARELAELGFWSGAVPGGLPDLAELGEQAERHAAAVAEAAGLSDAARLAWACRVLRAGAAPPASLHRALGDRAARHGPAALVVALAITDHGADPRSRQPARTKYLDAVLDSLADHARRSRTAPPPPERASPGGRPSGTGGGRAPAGPGRRRGAHR